MVGIQLKFKKDQMEKDENNPKSKRIEKALRESYSAEVPMDRTFKKNLDKLVENTIKSQKLDQHASKLQNAAVRKRGFLSIIFRGARWQVAFLSSFFGILLLGGVAFAAVPQLREVIIPTKGNLYVNSTPEGALVYLKGEEYSQYTSVGKTPLRTKIKAGDYELKLTLEDYEEYTRDFELEAGKSVNLEINLRKKNAILDTIKEWKTYTDLENGFEFTYPLSWNFVINVEELEKQEFPPIEVVGENSKFRVYTKVLNAEMDSDEIEINGKTYTGIEDSEGWEFIVFEEVTSQDNSNSIKIAFYTNVEEEMEIYDFMRSVVKVYEIEEQNDEVTEWTTYTQAEIGFSFRYPSSEWMVVEKERLETSARYEIVSIGNDIEPLTVIYSYGYYQDLKDYEFDEEVAINGLEVSKYHSGSCDGKFLYEFPNRLYIVYQTSDDLGINDTMQKIVESFNVFDGDEFQEISNYKWGFSMTFPSDWTYQVVSGEEEFDGTEHVQLASSVGKTDIYSWADISEKWDEFLASIDLDNARYRTSNVRIEGRDYIRTEVWIHSGGNYILEKIIYLADFSDDLTSCDSKVTVGEAQLVVMFDSEITLTSIDEITTQYQQTFSEVDAMVASLRVVEG